MNWLQQKYPKLESFELKGDENVTAIQLVEFLHKNRNIKSFTTDVKCFLSRKCVNLISKYELKVDDFIICRDYTIEDMKLYACDIFNRLYQEGFYKQLQFHRFTDDINQEAVNQFASLKALNSLRCGLPLLPIPSVNWSPLTNLRKITIYYYPQPDIGMQEVAKSLVNLEEVSLFQVRKPTFDDH